MRFSLQLMVIHIFGPDGQIMTETLVSTKKFSFNHTSKMHYTHCAILNSLKNWLKFNISYIITE